MFFSEISRLTRLDIDYADDAVLGDQRNGQLGADVGDSLNVAGVLSDIVDEHGLARLGGLASDSLSYFDAAAVGELRWIANLEAETQFLSLLIQQKDGKNLVINDPANHLGHAG